MAKIIIITIIIWIKILIIITIIIIKIKILMVQIKQLIILQIMDPVNQVLIACKEIVINLI